MALKKLTINAFKNPGCTEPHGSLNVMFNPESFSRDFNADYETIKISGQNKSTEVFKRISKSGLKLELIADGTGVVAFPSGIKSVDEYIEKIKDLAYSYHGEKHRPNFLKIEWGSLSVICVCSALKATYTLFKEDGSALRAKIDLELKETTDLKTKAKEAKKSSPDLTHIRTVKAGDTLPLMACHIYGDSSYYLEVARINQLNSVHNIKPGDQIYFPPIKK